MTKPIQDDEPDPSPCLAIRRLTDRCFHRVEEVVPEGYIVEGILIPHDEVVETRTTNTDGSPKRNDSRPEPAA